VISSTEHRHLSHGAIDLTILLTALVMILAIVDTTATPCYQRHPITIIALPGHAGIPPAIVDCAPRAREPIGSDDGAGF
jgi:hypothetical protein